MILWMSAEIQADVNDAYSVVRSHVLPEVNSILQTFPGPESVAEWAYLAIILKDGPRDYGEVAKLHRKRKVAEFRLKIPHGEFQSASDASRHGMVLRSLVRSLGMMNSIGVRDLDVDTLTGLLSELGRNNGWLSAADD
jgi:hypothetical protein